MSTPPITPFRSNASAQPKRVIVIPRGTISKKSKYPEWAYTCYKTVRNRGNGEIRSDRNTGPDALRGRIWATAPCSCDTSMRKIAVMNRTITQIRRRSTMLVAGAYVAAIVTLTWLTVANCLGDQLFGIILEVMLAFPISLVGTSLRGWLADALMGEQYSDPTWVSDYVLLSWPGIVMAAILTLLLIRNRTRAIGVAAGSILAAAVTIAGLSITFSEWAPRRPYGWPFLIYGLVLLIGLFSSRERNNGTGQAAKGASIE